MCRCHLDWKSRVRLHDDMFDERRREDLIIGMIDAFDKMRSLLNGEGDKKSMDGVSSIRDWSRIIRANVDVVAVLSKVDRGEVDGGGYGHTAEGVLQDLEDIISMNAGNIIRSLEDVDSDSVRDCMVDMERDRLMQMPIFLRLKSSSGTPDLNAALNDELKFSIE